MNENIGLKVCLFIIAFVLIVIVGFIGTTLWYNMDLEKCQDIKQSGNSYYEAKNNCWETFEKPLLVQIQMFIIIILLPGLIWLFFIIMHFMDL
ncbi:MAG: hypothetical protein WC979_09920 [Candidatus Pacearchaeota archaeon]|jgi:hypothetical protein